MIDMNEIKIFNDPITWYQHDPPMKLGESPIFRASDSTLHWLDFVDKPCKLYILQIDPVTAVPVGHARVVNIARGEYVSVIRFRKNVVGSYICAYSRGIGYLDEQTGEIEVLKELVSEEESRNGIGLNDGGVDPQGRFWVGGLDLKILQSKLAGDPAPAGGWLSKCKLWVFDGSQCTSILDGVICGNGLGWSPDGKSFYFNDSGQQGLWRYEYDGVAVQISNPTLVIDGLGKGILNDGMVVDVNGNLWVAMWMDSCIKVFNPEGSELHRFDLPAKCITCPAWVGHSNDHLLLTSAIPLIGDAPPGDQGGGLFCLNPNITGMPIREFDG